MESKKKKKDFERYPRITYCAPNRKFERLLQESTLEEVKNVVRAKLGLSGSAKIELTQRRDADLLDLEDDQDFRALLSFAHANGSVEVVINGLQSHSAVPSSRLKADKDNQHFNYGDVHRRAEKPVSKKRKSGEIESDIDTQSTKKTKKVKNRHEHDSVHSTESIQRLSSKQKEEMSAPESHTPSKPTSKRKRSKSVGQESAESILTLFQDISAPLSLKRKRPKTIVADDDAEHSPRSADFVDKWLTIKKKGEKNVRTNSASEVEESFKAGPSKLATPLDTPTSAEISTEKEVPRKDDSQQKSKKKRKALISTSSADDIQSSLLKSSGENTLNSRRKKKRAKSVQDGGATVSEKQLTVEDALLPAAGDPSAALHNDKESQLGQKSKKPKKSMGDSFAVLSAASDATEPVSSVGPAAAPIPTASNSTAANSKSAMDAATGRLNQKLDPSDILSRFYIEEKKKSKKRSNANDLPWTVSEEAGESRTTDITLSDDHVTLSAPVGPIISTETHLANAPLTGTPAETITGKFTKLALNTSNTAPKDLEVSIKPSETDSSDEENPIKSVSAPRPSIAEDVSQLTEAEKILRELQIPSSSFTESILDTLEQEEVINADGDTEEVSSLEEDIEDEHQKGPRTEAGIPIALYGEFSAFAQNESDSDESEEESSLEPPVDDSTPLEQTPPPALSPGKEAGLQSLSSPHTIASSQMALFKDVNDRGESVLDSHRGDDAVEEAMEEDNAVIKKALQELEVEYEKNALVAKRLTASESGDSTRVSETDDLGLNKPEEEANLVEEHASEIQPTFENSVTLKEVSTENNTGGISPPSPPSKLGMSTSEIDDETTLNSNNSALPVTTDMQSLDGQANESTPSQLEQDGSTAIAPGNMKAVQEVQTTEHVPSTPSRISATGMIRRMKDRHGKAKAKEIEEDHHEIGDVTTGDLTVEPTFTDSASVADDIPLSLPSISPSITGTTRSRGARANTLRSRSSISAEVKGNEVEDKDASRAPLTRAKKKAASQTNVAGEQTPSQGIRRSGRLREKPIVLVPPPPDYVLEEEERAEGEKHRSTDLVPSQLEDPPENDHEKVVAHANSEERDKSNGVESTRKVDTVTNITGDAADSQEAVNFTSTQAFSALFPSQLPSGFQIQSIHSASEKDLVQDVGRQPTPTESSSDEEEQIIDKVIPPVIPTITSTQSQSQYSYPFFQTLTDLSKRSDLFSSTRSSSPSINSLKTAQINPYLKKNLKGCIDDDNPEDESSSSSSESDNENKKKYKIPPERRAGSGILNNSQRTPSRKFSLSYINTT